MLCRGAPIHVSNVCCQNIFNNVGVDCFYYIVANHSSTPLQHCFSPEGMATAIWLKCTTKAGSIDLINYINSSNYFSFFPNRSRIVVEFRGIISVEYSPNCMYELSKSKSRKHLFHIQIEHE